MTRNKVKLSDAIRRGMKRNQERGLPINRWTQSSKLRPQLSRFDERFMELYEKGYSERQMTRILKVGRGTIHRTKRLLGLLKVSDGAKRSRKRAKRH
jgi:predicted Ser/Thr protein kinase